MSKEITTTNHTDVRALIENIMAKVARYRVLLFVLLIASVYGFLAYNIYSLSSVEPDQASVDSQITSLTPSIDESVAKQLQSLQDNSVNVKSLFTEARNNPFSE